MAIDDCVAKPEGGVVHAIAPDSDTCGCGRYTREELLVALEAENERLTQDVAARRGEKLSEEIYSRFSPINRDRGFTISGWKLERWADTVAALEAENEQLRERARFLDALIAAGVDNWGGYSYAFELMEEMNNE